MIAIDDTALRQVIREEIRQAMREELAVVGRASGGEHDKLDYEEIARIARVEKATVREWVRKAGVVKHGSTRHPLVERADLPAVLAAGRGTQKVRMSAEERAAAILGKVK